MPHNFSAERPYYTFDSYARRTFGRKLYRLALAAGETAPTATARPERAAVSSAARARDGLRRTRGLRRPSRSSAKAQVCGKLGRTDAGPAYIAYFQSYTGTYAPLPRLRALLTDAADHPDIAALSVATRPDCLGEAVLDLLEELGRRLPVWVELGLQSASDENGPPLQPRLSHRAVCRCGAPTAWAGHIRDRACNPGPARRNAGRHAGDDRLSQPPARGRGQASPSACAPGYAAGPHDVYAADHGRVHRAPDRLPAPSFSRHRRAQNHGRRTESRPARAPVERGQKKGCSTPSTAACATRARIRARTIRRYRYIRAVHRLRGFHAKRLSQEVACMQRRVSRCRRFAAAFSFRRVSQGRRIASGGRPRPGKPCFLRETAAADASRKRNPAKKAV